MNPADLHNAIPRWSAKIRRLRAEIDAETAYRADLDRANPGSGRFLMDMRPHLQAAIDLYAGYVTRAETALARAETGLGAI